MSVAGVLAVAAMAPNALRMIDMFTDKKKRGYNRKYQVNKTIIKLQDGGLIEFKDRRGKKFACLTEKGKKKLLEYQLQEIKIKKPRKWDGKWRVIIFDIKEHRRFVRDGLRKELINLDFLRLQNSVWVHPYDCEEVIVMLKSHFKIGKDVLCLVVEKIENDKWLKKEFSLRG